MTIQEQYNELVRYRKIQSMDVINEKKRKAWEYFRKRVPVMNLEKNLRDEFSFYYAPVRQIRGSSLVCWPFPNRTEIYADETFALDHLELVRLQLTHEILHGLSETRDGKQFTFGYPYIDSESIYTGINEACTQVFAEDIEQTRLSESEDYLYFIKNIMRVMKVLIGEDKLANQYLGNDTSFEESFNRLTENKFMDFAQFMNRVYTLDKNKKYHRGNFTDQDEQILSIYKEQIVDFTKNLIEKNSKINPQLIVSIKKELQDEEFLRKIGLSKEQSYLKLFSSEMLSKYGLTLDDQNLISSLVDRAITEKLYIDTLDYQHDLKHIEKVLTYSKMIANRITSPINTSLLMIAGLYHDIGKTTGASNQEHGEVGATRFEQMMKGKMADKDIRIVSLLIKQHALDSDTITFTDDTFSDAEKKEIQLMSDILKDADALDRNRLNYPAPMGTCDINRLRTSEAKEIYFLSDSFYQNYCETIIRDKEKSSGAPILNNYELLEQWIEAFERGEENMFHASLNPGIEELQPTESTQKGSYVYAGINPVNCFTMAAFRVSLIFPRSEVYLDEKKERPVRAIKEIFEGSIKDTLDSKYITIYKLPSDKFHKYTAPTTAARTGEWVSEESVRPIQQVSFKAMDLLNYLEDKKRLRVVHDYSKEAQLSSFMSSFEVYIWNVKHLKEDAHILDKKWKDAANLIGYYAKDPKVIETMNRVRQDIDQNIYSYIENFKKKYGREPNYDNENECVVPIRNQFYEKYYVDGKKNQLNYEVLKKINSNLEDKSLVFPGKQDTSLTVESQFVHQVMSEVTSRLSNQLNSEELVVGIGKGLNDKMQVTQSAKQQDCIMRAKNDVIKAMEIGCDKKEEYVSVVTWLTEQRTTNNPERKQAIEQSLTSFKQSKSEDRIIQTESSKTGQFVKKNNSNNNPKGGFASVLTFSLIIGVVCVLAILMVYMVCRGV